MPSVFHQGREIAFEISGPAQAPAVLFANSIGTSLGMWDSVVSELGERFRTIRFDARGHGRSAPCAGPATIDDLAADALAVLDATKAAQAVIVGLSLGGMVAQALATLAPERVRGLVLCATGATLQPASAWEQRAATALAEGMEAFVALSLQRWFTPGFREAQPEAVDHCAAMLRATDAESYAACCRVIRDTDLRPRLCAVTQPTLLIAGAEDPATPPALLDEIAALLGGPKERLDFTPAAHILAVEQPRTTAAAIVRFVAGLPA